MSVSCKITLSCVLIVFTSHVGARCLTSSLRIDEGKQQRWLNFKPPNQFRFNNILLICGTNDTNNLKYFAEKKWVDVWWWGPGSGANTQGEVTVIWLRINFNSNEEEIKHWRLFHNRELINNYLNIYINIQLNSNHYFINYYVLCNCNIIQGCPRFIVASNSLIISVGWLLCKLFLFLQIICHSNHMWLSSVFSNSQAMLPLVPEFWQFERWMMTPTGP
jgi:hypothetical protein